MERKIHVFDNGVAVFDDHLLPSQRARYRRWNVHESEEEDLFVGLVRKIPRDGVFVDIGSAIGYYLLLAARLRPDLDVHGVEPLEIHRQRFLENVTLNGRAAADFTLHEEAISSADGVAPFLDDGYGSAIPRRTRAPTGKAIPTITLDHLVERIRGRVDLCQMDVQGHEIEVLEGGAESLRTGSISIFLIGTHGRRLHRGCIRRLTEDGYRILRDVVDPKGQPDGILVARR